MSSSDRAQQLPPGLNVVGHPVWWHMRGYKIRLTAANFHIKFVEFSASATKLTIAKHPTDNHSWIIAWHITHSPYAFADGQIGLSTAQLRSAFGIGSRPSYDDEEFRQLFLYDDAYPGHFIRYADYLNFPCPGTGHDGDPNISIYITGDMKDVIDDLTR